MNRTVIDGTLVRVEQTEHNAMFVVSYFAGDAGWVQTVPTMADLSEVLYDIVWRYDGDTESPEFGAIPSETVQELWAWYLDADQAAVGAGCDDSAGQR